MADFEQVESFGIVSVQNAHRRDSVVRCIGFPVGGENISVTRGVVSRRGHGLLRRKRVSRTDHESVGS